METLLAVGVMGACFALLGAGLLFGRKKNCVVGSCGGIGKDPNSDIACVTCAGDESKCPEKLAAECPEKSTAAARTETLR